MIKFIDSHCHLISYKYSGEELPDIIRRSVESGVDRIIATGTEERNWQPYLDLARRFPENIRVSLGIHPTDVHEAAPHWKETLLALVKDNHVAALGETGLDYFHNAPEGWETDAFREKQQFFLREHFDLAEKTGLNVVIHTRDRSGTASFDDALHLAAEYAGRVRCMFHCFIGTREQARRVLDIGGIVSFTGIVTFKNAPEVLDVARWCPPDGFLMETDAPYLAPEPFRGSRNEPAYVLEVAKKIALARGESLETLSKNTKKTAESFFSL